MKKLFYSVFVMALLFASCSKEEKFEDIESEDAVTTRAGEGSVNVSYADNTLYFTWDNRSVEAISIKVTDQDNSTIYYLPPFKLTTTSLSHSYGSYDDGFFKIEIRYSEFPEDSLLHFNTYFCESGRIYKLEDNPKCNHHCFDGSPFVFYRFGNSIALDLVGGEYIMIVYAPRSSVEHSVEERIELKLSTPQTGASYGTIVPIKKLVAGVDITQKIRIFTKNCPYGPGVCNSFIETDFAIDEQHDTSYEPTGSVHFYYCSGYWDY